MNSKERKDFSKLIDETRKLYDLMVWAVSHMPLDAKYQGQTMALQYKRAVLAGNTSAGEDILQQFDLLLKSRM